MRIRDIVQTLSQLSSNLVSGTTVKGTIPGIAEIEVSGQGLLELHKLHILVAKVVSTAFNQRRIYWHAEDHELKFIEPANRKKVCIDSMKTANTAIDTALSDLTHGTPAEATLADLLLAISTANKLITDRFFEIPELSDYNAWVLDIGGEANEKMTDEEHRLEYVKVIRDLRVKTYPLWESIIDLLPAGNVLQSATESLQLGRKGLGLDQSEVEQPWELIWP
jgi:hypothetical protein